MFYVLLHPINNYSHLMLYLSGEYNFFAPKKGGYYEQQKNTNSDHGN